MLSAEAEKAAEEGQKQNGSASLPNTWEVQARRLCRRRKREAEAAGC